MNGEIECFGGSSQEKKCNKIGCPVDCKWGKWTTWGFCTETCGGGTQVSTRVIQQEALNAGSLHNSLKVAGDNILNNLVKRNARNQVVTKLLVSKPSFANGPRTLGYGFISWSQID